jgi:hypothetical protein
MESNRKLIYMLWAVIAVLIIGTAIGGYMLVRYANDVDQANSELNSSNESLRRQLQEAKATPTPAPTPSALATPEPSPTPTLKPTPTPKPGATPAP